MDTRQRVSSGLRTYEPFDPKSQWIEDGSSSNLIVHLPGFKKEQIKVQVDTFGTLRVSAERPIEGNRWSRFRKDFSIPESTNVGDIKAKFENEALYVTVPKLITQKIQEEQPKPIQEPPVVQKQMEDDKKSEEGKMEPKKEDQEERKAGETPGAKESPISRRLSGMEKLSYGIRRLSIKAKRPGKLTVNVVAAVIVLVIGVAIYMRYKMRESGHVDNYEALSPVNT